jgi:hemerythrin
MFVAWTSDLSTGIDVIDGQHKRILDYINQLGEIVRSKYSGLGSQIKLTDKFDDNIDSILDEAIFQDRLSVGLVLNALVDYTVSHFAFEESLQEEVGYKFAKPHKAVHDIFIKRVTRYQEMHNAGEDIAKELHSMLSIWLVNHIKKDDMAYVNEVKTNILGIVSDKEKKKDDNWIKRFFS